MNAKARRIMAKKITSLIKLSGVSKIPKAELVSA